MTHVSDPHFAERVRASFARQDAMALIRATMPVIEHGRTEIHLPHWQGVEQQHGYIHGGVVGMIADSAAGYAAMTVVPASASVLTVENRTLTAFLLQSLSVSPLHLRFAGGAALVIPALIFIFAVRKYLFAMWGIANR